MLFRSNFWISFFCLYLTNNRNFFKSLMETPFDTLNTPTLTKALMSELLFEQMGLNRREAKDFIEAFFEIITAQLLEGKDVKVAGFGTFEVRSKSARPGRNPRTGEPALVPPKRTIVFKSGGLLKERINAATDP